mmetsp:Transcript_2944/g.4496  ORF Transcript_2944/g.4496 Transcript_2944/m.4496 type:complete len:586 (-) Transcript_2944:265-2022(-)
MSAVDIKSSRGVTTSSTSGSIQENSQVSLPSVVTSNQGSTNPVMAPPSYQHPHQLPIISNSQTVASHSSGVAPMANGNFPNASSSNTQAAISNTSSAMRTTASAGKPPAYPQCQNQTSGIMTTPSLTAASPSTLAAKRSNITPTSSRPMPLLSQRQQSTTVIPKLPHKIAVPQQRVGGGAQQANSKLSTIQKLAAQLKQVRELQAKLQATLAKKKAAAAVGKLPANPMPGNSAQAATIRPNQSMNTGQIQKQNMMIEKFSKHIRQLQQQRGAIPAGATKPPVRRDTSPAAAAQLFGAPPGKWNVGQVLRWLDSVGFGSYKDGFSRNGVDGRQLLNLTYTDLHGAMGIKNEDTVKRILSAVDTLRPPRANGEQSKKRTYNNMAMSTGSLPSLTTTQPRMNTGGRTKTRHKRSRKRFAWIATIESWVLEHEMHCSSYTPGEKQTQGPEPNICCNNLRNGAQYSLRVVPNSNKCCGVSDLIVLSNNETKQVVGSLPCSMTQFLAPLIQHDLIILTGATTCVIHPEGGVPPFELAVEADLMRLAGYKRDQQFKMHIRKLTCLLDNWEGDWIDSDYPTNIESIKNLLNID